MWFARRSGVLRRLGQALIGVNAIEFGRPVPVSEIEVSWEPSLTTTSNASTSVVPPTRHAADPDD